MSDGLVGGVSYDFGSGDGYDIQVVFICGNGGGGSGGGGWWNGGGGDEVGDGEVGDGEEGGGNGGGGNGGGVDGNLGKSLVAACGSAASLFPPRPWGSQNQAHEIPFFLLEHVKKES